MYTDKRETVPGIFFLPKPTDIKHSTGKVLAEFQRPPPDFWQHHNAGNVNSIHKDNQGSHVRDAYVYEISVLQRQASELRKIILV